MLSCARQSACWTVLALGPAALQCRSVWRVLAPALDLVLALEAHHQTPPTAGVATSARSRPRRRASGGTAWDRPSPFMNESAVTGPTPGMNAALEPS